MDAPYKFDYRTDGEEMLRAEDYDVEGELEEGEEKKKVDELEDELEDEVEKEEEKEEVEEAEEVL